MIITTIEELRLCFPSHAIDHIDAFVGYIDNSEHELLLQPLGQPLYDKLCEWYDQNKPIMSTVIDKNTGYYNQLAIIAQRCVAFDVMARDIDQHAISINGSGVNFSSAEDYKPADRPSIEAAKLSYIKEAHASLNRLLYTLEQWTAQCPTEEDVTDETAELYEICKFWRSSRYFYLAAQLFIPSAIVLQEYWTYFDSREKFIQMLPDLHFIQEEQIAPSIGEDFCEFLVDMQVKGGTKRDATAAVSSEPQTLADDSDIPAMLRRLLHKLRKIEATLLEGRTKVIKVDKDRRIAAHDEGIRLLGQWREYCQQHQSAILKDLDTIHGMPATAAALLSPEEQEALDPAVLNACLEAEQPFTDSPMFLAPVWESESEGTGSADKKRSAGSGACPCDSGGCDSLNHDGMAMLVTPPLL
jgi:hypothetical protein